MRCTQEMLFDEVGAWAARHVGDTATSATNTSPCGGTLRLDPAL